MGLIDKTGPVFPLILNTYGKNVFYTSKDTIVITIPIDKRPIDDSVNDTPYDKYYDLNNTEKSILKAIEKNSSIAIPELSSLLGLSKNAINNARDGLKDKGYIERIGSNKTGYWRILK